MPSVPAVPWSAALTPPATWRTWRVSEDAGVGAERRDVREAIDSLHARGFILRHTIERQVTGATAGEGIAMERVSREVTALSRQEIDARVFARPEGFAPAEYFAPAPDDAADDPAPEERGSAPGDPAAPGM